MSREQRFFRWWGCLFAWSIAAGFGAAGALATPPAFQAVGTADGGNGSVSPSWPAHQANDVALLFVETTGGEAASLSTPAGFVAVADSPQATGTGTNGTRLSVFWARATSASMAAPTVADAGNHVYAVIVTYRGVVETGNPWDATGGGVKATAGTSLSVGGVTTTTPETLVVQAASRDNDSAAAAFSAQANAALAGLAERVDEGSNAGNGGGVAVWDGVKTAAGVTGNTTATVVSSVNAFLTIALRPAPPRVVSIGRVGSGSVNAGDNVAWSVVFSEPVSGVDATDFVLVPGGGVTGAGIISVSPASGTTVTVTANSGAGGGTLGLNLVDNNSIANSAGAALGGPAANDGNFTGQTFSVFACTPPAGAPAGLTCVCDNFNRASLNPSTIFNSNFIATASDTTGVLPEIFNSGYLRLTRNTNANAKAVTVPGVFPALGNYISVEFRHYAYNGSGADGVAVTLSDYSVPPQPGAFGGSLGYAQKSNPGSDCTTPGGCPGFAGGWLGVALDEFGNFSNPSEGRSGGPGQRADSVTIRGSGSGMTGYRYIAHNQVGNVDNAGSGSAAPGHLYQVIVDARGNATGSGPTAVQVNRDTGVGYGSLISVGDIFATATSLGFTQAPVPANWQVSFTGSTGGATNIHEIAALKICALLIYPPTGGSAANFNAFDDSYGNSTLNALQGHLFTKLTGTPFALKVAALRDGNGDGVADGIQTSYVIGSATKPVRVELLDDSAGAPCNASAAACASCGKPVVASQSISFVAGDNGVKQTANFSVNDAYSRVVARMCEGAACPGSGAVGCSVDALAIRPTAFSSVTSSASNAGAGGTPVFRAGADGFSLTARANAPRYTGRPKLAPAALEARNTALAAGVVGNLQPVVSPAEAANTFPSNSTYANTPAVGPTASDVTATFTYGEAGSFRVNYPASPGVSTPRGLYDDDWTLVDQGSAGDCITGSYANIKNADGVAGNADDFKFGCSFGNTATSAWFGRFIPARFEVDPATSAVVNRSDLAATATAGPYPYAVGTTVLAVTAGTGGSFAVGEKIVVIGGGPGGAPLVTTVSAAGANTLTLATPLASAIGAAVSIFRPAAHAFTYVGEPLLAVAGLRAVNAAGSVTQNYAGFAVANWTDPAAANTLGLGLGNAGGAAITVDTAAATAGWAAGVASFAVPLTVDRGAGAVGPFPAAAIGVAPKDADGVALAAFDLDADNSGSNERRLVGTTALRYGRIRVANAFGSEKRVLPLPAEAQFWNGSFWEANALDTSGSALAATSINVSGSGAASTKVSYVAAGPWTTGAATPGRYDLRLTSTGVEAVDLGFGVAAWLRYPWGGGTTMLDPSARASFGVYPGTNRFIYRREVR